MRLTVCIATVLVLAACSKPAATPAADNAAEASSNAAVATPAAFQLNETSWTFKDKGKDMAESIDASGNWVASSGGKDVDHGTSVMKGDKACFTSAVDKKSGEECWTTKPVEVGQSMDTTSDKGRKLTVTRVAYVPAIPPAN